MWSGGLARLAVSLLVIVPLVAPATGDAAASGRVEQVTLTRDQHGPVVVVRTSRPLRYRTNLIASPQRLVLDFEDARFAWLDGPLRPEAGPVTEIRGSQFRPGVARVVIALGRAVPHRIEGTAEGLRVAFHVIEPAAPAAAPRASIEPVTAPEPAVAPPRTGATRAGRPVLYGIVLRGDASVAYMEDPRTRRVTGFKLGDAVGGAVVEAIEERHVTLRTPSGAVDLRVDDPKPGPAAPRIQIGPGASRP